MITHITVQDGRKLSRKERAQILKAIRKAQQAFWTELNKSLGFKQTKAIVNEETGFSFDYGCERAAVQFYLDNNNRQTSLDYGE